MDRIIDVPKINEEFSDVAGPSGASQGYGTSPLSECELNKRRLRDRLQQIYISAYILKRVNSCPDTSCSKLDPIWDVVEHLLEVHYDIPNAIIELDNHYSIPIEVDKLQYGRCKTVAILLIPIANMRDNDTPSDRSTMPLVMLAAKIQPCEILECSESLAGATSTMLTSAASTSVASTSAASTSAASTSTASTSTALTSTASTSAASTSVASTSTAGTKPINDGDMIMIWICGHIPTISSIIKISNCMENQIHLYRGYIHSISDNNNNPNTVFSRGNCLLVAAQNIAVLTHQCKIPLDVEITLKMKEEELI